MTNNGEPPGLPDFSNVDDELVDDDKWLAVLKTDKHRIKRKVNALFRFFSHLPPDRLEDMSCTIMPDANGTIPAVSEEVAIQVLNKYLETNCLNLEEEFNINENQVYLAIMIGVRAEQNARNVDFGPLCSMVLLDIFTYHKAKLFLMDVEKQKRFADVFVIDTMVTPICACVLLTMIHAEIEGWPLTIEWESVKFAEDNVSGSQMTDFVKGIRSLLGANMDLYMPASNNVAKCFKLTAEEVGRTYDSCKDNFDKCRDVFKSTQLQFHELQQQRNIAIKAYVPDMMKDVREMTVEERIELDNHVTNVRKSIEQVNKVTVKQTVKNFQRLLSLRPGETTVARRKPDDTEYLEDVEVLERIDQNTYHVRFLYDNRKQNVTDADIAVPSLPMYSRNMRSIAAPGLRVAAYVLNRSGFSDWYSGTIAVQPTITHKHRYLVFFDCGFEEYVDAPHDPRSKVVEQVLSKMTDADAATGCKRRRIQKILPLAKQALSSEETVGIDPLGNQLLIEKYQVFKLLRNVPARRQFISNYFLAYPEWHLCRMNQVTPDKPCQIVHVLDKNNQRRACRVIHVDVHMCVIRFPFENPLNNANGGGECSVYPCKAHSHTDERMFRGHPRIMDANKLPSNMSKRGKQRYNLFSAFDEVEPENDDVSYTGKKQRPTARKTTGPTKNAEEVEDPKLQSSQDQLEEQKKLQNNYTLVHMEIEDRLPDLAKHSKCTTACLRGKDKNPNSTEFHRCSPLHIPMACGWTHHVDVYKSRTKKTEYIRYKAPCGKCFTNIQQIGQFLRDTKSQLTIDLFSFEVGLRPSAFVEVPVGTTMTDDYAVGMEGMPIPAVNTVNKEQPPDIIYDSQRFPYDENVDMSTIGEEFCSGCSCTDDCSDPEKCECQQLTKENWKRSAARFRMQEYGFKNRMLATKTVSGIFECNRNCQCNRNNCYNRVVQNPIKFPIQIFKTCLSGWGVRTLVDIPKGAFIANYVGALLTDSIAEALTKQDDAYFADIDFMDVMEREKQAAFDQDGHLDLGFESDESEEKNEKKNRDDDDDGFSSEDSSGSDFEDEQDGRKRKKELARGKGRSKKRDRNSQEKDKKKAKKDKDRQEMQGVDVDQLTETFDFTNFFGEENFLYVIDAKQKGNVGRFLNHSCDPNVEVQHVFVDTHDMRLPWSSFFAARSIKAGTELCWNYNYSTPNPTRPLNLQLFCKCGSSNCVGRLL